MFYLLACSVMFLVAACLGRNRFEWLTLSGLYAANYTLTLILGSEGSALYALVPIVTFVSAVMLCKPRTALGFYHAIILLSTLIAYAALAFDVSQGRHVLIYNNYEAVIYGLVGCQLVTVFTALLSAYNDYNTSGDTNLARLQGNSRS